MNHCFFRLCFGLLWLVALSFQAARGQDSSGAVRSHQVATHQIAWELGPTGSPASLRGLSAPGDEVIWACGSGGTVLRSTDGGSGWIECGPDDFSELEFRSIHAWDAQSACIASAGTPAVVLKTEDAGTTWREVYRHPAPEAFFDGLKFFDDQRGVVFGDPIAGVFCILESSDGGEHWQAITPQLLPAARDSEAAFAASNSAMFVAGAGRIWIGTGGRTADTSRVLFRENWSAPWNASTCPLLSSPTAGIFSIAGTANRQLMVAVGGDYRDGEPSTTTAAWSADAGRTWSLASHAPTSFCSAVMCVEIPNTQTEIFVATGPEGSYRSVDGVDWEKFSASGFHALAAGPNKLFAVGASGRFARVQW